MTTVQPVLAVRGVDKSFASPEGARPVLVSVDLTVHRGEIVALAGRSGSGKTTLLTLVAGFDQPDAGSITVLGADAGTGRSSWSDLAILPQSLGLLDELTVAENVDLPRRLAGRSAAAEDREVLGALGIDHLVDRYPDEISLGEQQRVALARAAVLQPGLLVADEPISHQNQAWAERMMAYLGSLAAGGTTCLLATHNEVAFDAANRVLELRSGRLHERAPHDPTDGP